MNKFLFYLALAGINVRKTVFIMLVIAFIVLLEILSLYYYNDLFRLLQALERK